MLQNELRKDFEKREATSAPYVRQIVKEVKETGILIDKPKRDKPKTARTPKNIAAIWQKKYVKRHQDQSLV